MVAHVKERGGGGGGGHISQAHSGASSFLASKTKKRGTDIQSTDTAAGEDSMNSATKGSSARMYKAMQPPSLIGGLPPMSMSHSVLSGHSGDTAERAVHGESGALDPFQGGQEGKYGCGTMASGR